VSCDGTPIGACGLKNKTTQSAEYWGYIGERIYHGHGLGYSMLQQVIQKAEEMELDNVILKVLLDNLIAINLYKKCGFAEYRRDSRFIYMIKNMCNNSNFSHNADTVIGG
jgi:RimJ/RimL family protein N-acetyltransferase